MVQVHPFSRELLRRFAESDRPPFLALSADLGGSQPLTGQSPDRRESSEPGPKPSLRTQPPEAQETTPPQARRQGRLGLLGLSDQLGRQELLVAVQRGLVCFFGEP